MKNSYMKRYRLETKKCINLYKQGIISEKEMGRLISYNLEKLIEGQVNQQLDKLTISLCKSYGKG